MRLQPQAALVCIILLLGSARPLAASAAGPGSAIAQNPTAHAVYLAVPSAGDVLVLAQKDKSLLTVLKAPPEPVALAVDPAHRHLYVASDQAGMISVFDTKTYALLRIYPIGGHPTGLALTDKGRTLLISDDMSGAVESLPVLRLPGQTSTLFNIGPGAAPLLAPRAAWHGASTLVWARGFAPGEPVTVRWGWQPVAYARADAAGFVTTSFRVPANAALTEYVVFLQGARSTTTESALLNVIKAPKIARRVHKVPKPHTTSLVQRLLAPSITLPIANPLAHSKARTAAHHHGATAPAHTGMSIPIIALAAVPLLLLLFRRVTRRRRGDKKGRKAGKGKRGASAPAMSG